MSSYGGANIVTDGLIVNLDPMNYKSLPSDPTVNLIQINPTPTGSTTGYAVGTVSYTASYNATEKAFEYETGAPEYWGWYFHNTSLFTTKLVTSSLYTISFEWKFGSKNNYSGSLLHQICQGNGQVVASSFVFKNSGSANPESNTVLQSNGYYKTIYTFTPASSGSDNDRQYRIIGNTFNSGSTQRIHMFWRNLQLEKLPYASDFISGSRSTIINDLSGYNVNGYFSSSSFSGSIPSFPFANADILNFDGTGSYIALNATPATASNFTIETMINMRTLTAGQQRFYSNSGMGTFCFRYDGTNTLDMQFHYNPLTGSLSSTATSLTGITYQPNTWYHLVTTNNIADGTKFYVNGILRSTGITARAIPTSTHYIGANNGTQFYTNCYMSAFRIYNRDLTAQEILQNYTGLKSRYNL